MRFATFALAVFGAAISVSASLVARQNPYPACAEPCLNGADTGSHTGSCASTDLKCLCNNNDFIASTTSCIQSKCTGDDITKAQTFATGLCSSVGVTLTPSASSGSATGSSTGSATGSATGTVSGSASATSPSASSTPTTATGSSTGSPSLSPTSGATNNGVAMIGVAAAAIAAFAL